MIYTLTLNPAIDYVVRLEGSLTPGAINRSREEAYQFGGKGINVSNVLHQLGLPTTALGFIAGFTGKALAEGLEESGLATRFITLPRGQTRINVKVKAREESEINGAGPEITPEDMALLYRQLDALTAGDALVLSGSVPAGLGADTYGQILRRMAGKSVLCVVDAAGPLLENALPHRPFLIKPNLPELEALAGQPLTGRDEILAAARGLQMQGAENVLVSMAAEGAILLTREGDVYTAACPQGQVINSVGAGDSMVAGFLAGWLENGDYRKALDLAIASGSATAFSLGLATEKQIRTLLKKMSP